MVNVKDATIINKVAIPTGKVVGAYTFLRDMGKSLGKDKAILITTTDATEAKRLQNRWRAYFKREAHTRKEVKSDGKIYVYLWLKK